MALTNFLHYLASWKFLQSHILEWQTCGQSFSKFGRGRVNNFAHLTWNYSSIWINNAQVYLSTTTWSQHRPPIPIFSHGSSRFFPLLSRCIINNYNRNEMIQSKFSRSIATHSSTYSVRVCNNKSLKCTKQFSCVVSLLTWPSRIT